MKIDYVVLFKNCRLDDVKWDGKNIVVLGDVRITEPYTVKDLYTLDGRPPQTLDHVSKIVSESLNISPSKLMYVQPTQS